jgi:hypothetical protein
MYQQQHVSQRRGASYGGWRAPPTRMWVILIVALAGSLAVINVLRIMTADESFGSATDVDGALSSNLKLFPVGAPDAAAVPQHLLPASIVRIEGLSQSAAGSRDSRVKLVLSVDSADIADLLDAYRRGFAPVTERYPDDGGFLMHNKHICRRPLRGRFESRPISWIVFVHSSPADSARHVGQPESFQRD